LVLVGLAVYCDFVIGLWESLFTRCKYIQKLGGSCSETIKYLTATFPGSSNMAFFHTRPAALLQMELTCGWVYLHAPTLYFRLCSG